MNASFSPTLASSGRPPVASAPPTRHNAELRPAPIVAPTRAVLSHPEVEIGHLVPDTKQAVAFLDILDDEGRHDLFAIDPDLPRGASGQTEAATFFKNQRAEMFAWIEKNQGKRNIYYSVNRARDGAPLNKRLSAGDIGYIRAIVGDFDVNAPPRDASRASHGVAERERLAGLAGNLRVSNHAPTLVADTGGLQPIWLIVPAAPASPENAAVAEGIGLTLQQRHDGDSVSDLPRIMRLPGTINLLNQEKRLAGRVATVVALPGEFCAGVAYALDEMKALVPPIACRPDRRGDADLPAIDMEAVFEASEYDELPPGLRSEFEAACKRDPVLKLLWDGHSAPEQSDETPSGFEWALAGRIKRQGTLTPTNYAQLVAVWAQRSEKHADDFDRRVARNWGRHSAPYGEVSGKLGDDGVR